MIARALLAAGAALIFSFHAVSAATLSLSGTFDTDFGTPSISGVGSTINIEIVYDSSISPTTGGSSSIAAGIAMIDFVMLDSARNIVKYGTAPTAGIELYTSGTLLFRQIGGVTSASSDIASIGIGFRSDETTTFSSAEISSLDFIETLLTTSRISDVRDTSPSFGVDDNIELSYTSGSDGHAFNIDFASITFDPTNTPASPIPLPPSVLLMSFALGWLGVFGRRDSLAWRKMT